VHVPPRAKLGLLPGGVRGLPAPLLLRLRRCAGGRVRRARAVARGALLPPGRYLKDHTIVSFALHLKSKVMCCAQSKVHFV
jgi:hypothetical protein